MDYKLISFDLDGTLFGKDMEISPENAAALAELTSRGVTVVANTGRCYGELPATARENPAIRYYICSNGASLYDKHTDTVLWSAYLSNATANTVFDILFSSRVSIAVHSRGEAYLDLRGHTEENYISYRVPHGFRVLYFSYLQAIPDFVEFLRKADSFESIVAFFADDREKEECTAKLREIEDIFVVATAPTNIEIVSKKAGKGHGLRVLCDRLGIPHGATIAVGDSINDIDHLRAAGLGLAMENATSATKAAASAIACHHTEPVAQYILDRYIKN